MANKINSTTARVPSLKTGPGLFLFYSLVVKTIMSLTVLLRFLFGVVLAGGVALWGGIPFPIGFIFVVSVGIIAAIWGDKFLLGFMSLMRYLK